MHTMNLRGPSPTAWLLSSLCITSGIILYILTAGAWANVFWGSIYGLGFLILSLFLSFKPGIGGMSLFIAGGFLWPIISTILITNCLEVLLRTWRRGIVIGLVIVTNLLLYPMAYAAGTLVYYLPIYGVFWENF
jgi:hypothetical protein